MSYEQSQVAFVDTETTGLDPERDHVWEIAVIRDGEEYVWQQRLPPNPMHRDRPDWTIVNPWVLENTGIRDRYDHESALDPHQSIENLIRLVKGRHVVGACPWFDSERLHRLDLKTVAPGGSRDLKWHYHLIDVENLAVGFLRAMSLAGRSHEPYNDNWSPELPWKSRELSLGLGVDPADFQPKHSALADARWAKAVFEAIVGGPA